MITKEKAKELSEILEAYSEGKAIEVKYQPTGDWYTLTEFNNSIYNNYIYGAYKLRVKPEPKLVPFTFEDGHLFLNKVVKGKAPFLNEKMRSLVVSCNVEFVWTGTVSAGVNYSRFLNEFEFEDGSPCGKYIE